MGKVGRPTIHSEGVKIVKTVIYLEEEEHRRLKHLAVDEGASMTEMVRQAIHHFLDRPLERSEATRPPEKVNERGKRGKRGKIMDLEGRGL